MRRLRCFIGRHFFVPFGPYDREQRLCMRCGKVRIRVENTAIQFIVGE